MNNQTAILVLSCDKYADIWPVFFKFFDKYWPDCPYKVYLGTNSVKFTHLKVTQIFSNINSNWSDELKLILEQISEQNLIIILEDYFIYEKVNNKEMDSLIHLFNKKDAAFMRLACFPAKYDELWPYKEVGDEVKYGEIVKGAKYRVCLQTAIWSKNTLLGLLKPGESPWQFEIEGSKRSVEINYPFLNLIADPDKKHVHGPITYYCTALSAGKWMRGALDLCRKNNIAVDSKREVESYWDTLKRKLYIGSPLYIRKLIDFVKHRSGLLWN